MIFGLQTSENSSLEFSSNKLRGKDRIALAAVILIGMLIRAAVPLLAFSSTHDITIFHSLDTLSYVEPAKSIIERGEFSTHDKPETIRTPGYPLFLFLGLAFDNLEFVTIVLQILASGLTIYFVYVVTLLLSREIKASLLAALLFACEPSSIIWASIVQTETLFATLLMGGVLYGVRYMQRSYWSDILASCAFLVCAIYVRPAAYFLPMVLAILWLGRGILVRCMNRALACQVLLFLAVCYGVVALWQVRNGFVAGYWGFSTVSENNLYFFAATNVMAQVTNTPYEEQRRLMIADRPKKSTGDHGSSEISENELRRYRSSRAIKIILRHPVAYAKVVCLSTLWTALGPGIGPWLEVFRVVSGDRMHRATEDDKFYYIRFAKWSRWGSIFLGVVLGSYWVGAFIGGIRAMRDNKWELLLLLLVMAYFVLSPALLCIGYSRFRHPIMPLLSVLAGYGVWALRQRLPRIMEG